MQRTRVRHRLETLLALKLLGEIAVKGEIIAQSGPIAGTLTMGASGKVSWSGGELNQSGVSIQSSAGINGANSFDGGSTGIYHSSSDDSVVLQNTVDAFRIDAPVLGNIQVLASIADYSTDPVSVE